MMKRIPTWLGVTLVALVVLGACSNLKYVALKGTSVPNPPTAPIKVYVKEFPVKSIVRLVDPTAAVSTPYDTGRRSGGGGNVSGLVASTRDIEISRPSRIEDLSGSVLRELRREEIRVFTDLDQVTDLTQVRSVHNPFELVPSDVAGVQLEISGRAVIRSRRVSKKFNQKTDSVDIVLIIKDMATGEVFEKELLKVGINMIFNSTELEEAMAVAVMSHLMQKTPF